MKRKPSDVWALVYALEQFIDAKISYEHSRRNDPEWSSTTDVNETRDNLMQLLEKELS